MIIGKSDIIVKDWLKNRNRFADLFNGIIFEGKNVIEPQDLIEKDSETGIVLKGKSMHRRRDIVMQWKSSFNLIVLAIESQKKINYAMPIRNMLYDSLEYVEQMKTLWSNLSEQEKPLNFSDEFFSRFRKEDCLYPVMTLVLYYGDSGEWDGATSIFDLFGNEFTDEEIEVMKNYVCDYKVNLVELDKLTNIDIFKSDLRETIGMLQCRYDENKMAKYIENNSVALSKLDIEASRFIKEVLSIGKLDKYIKQENGKKVADMCKAWDDHRLSGIREGMKEGIKEGMKEGIRILIVTSKEYGVANDIIKVKLLEKYELSEKEADEYMKEYA